MVENDTNNQNTDNTQNDNKNQQSNNASGSCVYDKWGRTPDKSLICAIGIKSASADTQSGVIKAVFKNSCPHCGNPSLMWGWNWENDQEKVSKFDGTDGTSEGHIYCVQSEGGCDADYSVEGNEHINGSSYKLTVVSPPTPSSEEEAQKMSNGQLACDGSVVAPEVYHEGGSATLIPDKTFYGLIKQIIGAVDAVFIIANNMAYLLSFKQLYAYRNKYEDYILELKPSEIIVDSIVKNWTSDGFYNAVEVTYSGGIVKYQHDALIQIYGEQTFYYEFPDDDEETAKAKANALLSAHVRDYSLDLQLNCIYNPNITVGAWIKIPKTLTKVSGAVAQQTGELNEDQTGTKIKRKGVTIENIIATVQESQTGESKRINSITTEDGNTYDIEVSSDDYEIYFVQGYKLKWRPDHSPIMSLHLKYGPDTPEDPVNATVGTGGISTSNGGFGDDCFYICAIMPNNCALVNSSHTLSPSDLHQAEFQPSEENLKSRCKKDSNLAKDMAGKTPQEVHNAIRAKFGYCLYSDSCSLWPCVSDMYDQACGANCGDTTRILKCALDAIGVKNWGVHIYNHYFNALELNGEWVTIDGTGSYDYSNSAGWPAGPKPADCCEPNQQEKSGAI